MLYKHERKDWDKVATNVTCMGPVILILSVFYLFHACFNF